MLTSSGAFTFTRNRITHGSFGLTVLSAGDLNSQMSVNSFMVHQETIHGKLSEVMKMLALQYFGVA